VRDFYDYVIVGAGSAGCAVANRLSADPTNTVLLVESGPADTSLFIDMPRGIGVLVNPGSKHIWEYDVATGGNGPTERWFRGRTLGGSSSINGMVYMRGAPLDYDGWASQGCHGWGWDEVLPIFVAMENHDLGAASDRGDQGPLRISTHHKGDPLFDAILAAGEQMGIPRVADVNSLHAVREGGLGYQPTTRFANKRFSAARAFLDPIKQRPNLHIVTGTAALRIEFEGKRAAAVVLRNASGTFRVKAHEEVVVSAGAIETPKLLQLSGIGSGPALQGLGIDVVVDAPEVGKNLREHRHADLTLKVRGHSQNKDLSGMRAGWSVLKYLLGNTGPMTHAAHEIGGFAKSEADLDHADLQFGLMSLSASSTGKGGAVALDADPGITFVTYFTRPESQGEVKLASADPAAVPLINVNHLSAEIDRRKFIGAFRWNRRLAQQPALAPHVVAERSPAAELNSDDEILAHAMEISGSCFHTAGTARMGGDEGAVVDPRLKVRGLHGLRIADTSIMPTLVCGPPNSSSTTGAAMAPEARANGEPAHQRSEWSHSGALPFIAMFGITGSAAYTYSSGILMDEVVREFGWTRTQFSSALTMQMLLGILIMPLAGRLIDRVGPRRVILVGMAPVVAAFSLFALLDGQLWQLWLFSGVLAVSLGAISPAGWYAAVVRSFDRWRGLALALSLAGVGLAATIWPILAANYVAILGWRLAYPALILTWAVPMLPLVVFLFRPAAAPVVQEGKKLPPLGPIVRSRTFLCLLGAGGLFASVSLGLTINLVPILRERGIDLTTAASIAGVAGLSSIAGRVGTGFLLDRVPTRPLAVFAFCLILPAIALLATGGQSIPILIAAAALVGLSAGAETDVVTYLTSRRFDVRIFGSVYSVFQAGFAICASLGPLLAGRVYDLSGSYDLYLLVLVPVVLMATVLIVLVPTNAPEPALED
jgi:choline dehydrogenase